MPVLFAYLALPLQCLRGNKSDDQPWVRTFGRRVSEPSLFSFW